ncbi:hypothetical protein [Sphingobium xanthum]|uniref:hypothetical protein n=1 Tax=Sphingobium xanthum TaxID=1387165 RepID=UPI003D1D7270
MKYGIAPANVRCRKAPVDTSLTLFEIDTPNNDSRAVLGHQRILADLVGLPRSLEGCVNKINADDTQAHADHSGGAHYVSPKGGSFLSYQILFVALICAAFVASIVHALSLLDRGHADTGLGYLLVGISGIFCSLIIGLPSIFGGL